MQRAEVIDLINEIENKYAVHQWKIENIHVWPLIRINIAFQLFNKFNNSNEIVTKNQIRNTTIKKSAHILKSAFSFLKAYFDDYKNNAEIKKYDTIFLTHSISRSFLVNGKMYNIFSDPFTDILSNLNMKTLVLEYAPHNEYRIPRYNPSMFIDLQLLFLQIKRHFLRKKIDNITYINNDYKRLDEYLQTKVNGFNLGEINGIYRNIRYIRAVANFFKKIFSIVNPHIGIVVNYYGIIGMAFNLACREFGIPSMDVQHGVQGSLHPAYGRWHCVPEKGYALLPSRFLCWSEKEAAVIEEWSKKVSDWHLPIVLGNLCIDMFKDKNNPLVKYFGSKIHDIINNNKKELNILITLQTGRGLQSIFKDAIESSPKSWFWWVRMHPAMQADQIKIINDLRNMNVSNYNLEDASALPLYGLLPQMDVHVTEWSTTVIEAAQFGVLSVITHNNGCEYYSEHIASGVAVKAFTKDDLIRAISDQANKKKRNVIRPASVCQDYEKSVSTIKSLVAQFYCSKHNNNN